MPTVGRRRRLLVALIVLAIVGADQLSKAWAVSRLADGPIGIIGKTVELHLTRNTGSAFSLFRNVTPLLAGIAVVVAVYLVRSLRSARDPAMLVALALVLAGAIGNLGDRVFRSPGFLRGAVVDFVHVGWWPTFNVADSAITIGAIVLVMRALLGKDDEPERAR